MRICILLLMLCAVGCSGSVEAIKSKTRTDKIKISKSKDGLKITILSVYKPIADKKSHPDKKPFDIMLRLKSDNNMVVTGIAENLNDTKLVKLPIDDRQRLSFIIQDEHGNTYSTPKNNINVATFTLGRLNPGDYALFELLCGLPIKEAKQVHIDMASIDLNSSKRYTFRIPIRRKKIKLTCLQPITDAFATDKELNAKHSVEAFYIHPDYDVWVPRWNGRIKLIPRYSKPAKPREDKKAEDTKF